MQASENNSSCFGCKSFENVINYVDFCGNYYCSSECLYNNYDYQAEFCSKEFNCDLCNKLIKINDTFINYDTNKWCSYECMKKGIIEEDILLENNNDNEPIKVDEINKVDEKKANEDVYKWIREICLKANEKEWRVVMGLLIDERLSNDKKDMLRNAYKDELKEVDRIYGKDFVWEYD